MEPDNNDRMNRIRKITNRTLAIPAEVEAIPPNPKIPAMMAMIKNVRAQLSIGFSLFDWFVAYQDAYNKRAYGGGGNVGPRIFMQHLVKLGSLFAYFFLTFGGRFPDVGFFLGNDLDKLENIFPDDLSDLFLAFPRRLMEQFQSFNDVFCHLHLGAHCTVSLRFLLSADIDHSICLSRIHK